MAKGKKRKIGASDVILILGILVIMIPAIILLYIILGAAKESNTPINGNRFDGEKTVEISQQQLTDVQTAVQAISSVEACKVEDRVSTVRVYVDVRDALSKEEYAELLKEIYAAVDSKLPVATYFTQSGTNRQYDLEIHAYNSLELKDAESYVYQILVKNSNMAEYQINEVSDAINEELAKELRGENTSETTVDGEGEEEPSEEGTSEETQSETGEGE